MLSIPTIFVRAVVLHEGHHPRCQEIHPQPQRQDPEGSPVRVSEDELEEQLSEEEQIEEQKVGKPAKKKKKQKEIKEFHWTRIMRRTGIEQQEVQVFEGLNDLLESEAIEVEDIDLEIKSQKFHFHPEAYREEDWPEVLKGMRVSAG